MKAYIKPPKIRNKTGSTKTCPRETYMRTKFSIHTQQQGIGKRTNLGLWRQTLIVMRSALYKDKRKIQHGTYNNNKKKEKEDEDPCRKKVKGIFSSDSKE